MRAQLTCIAVLIAATTLLAGAPQRSKSATAQPRKAAPTQKRPTPAPAPPTEMPVPFQVGETLTYDISWSSYLGAGSAVIRVADKRQSYHSTAYYIVAEARPSPLVARIYALYYRMDSLMDSSTNLSQRGSLYSEEGSRHRYASTTLQMNAWLVHVTIVDSSNHQVGKNISA